MLKLQLAILPLVILFSSFAYGETLSDKVFPAKKDVACGLTPAISQQLQGSLYKEDIRTVIGFGPVDNTSIIVIYKSLEKKTFSIVETFAEGYSCIIAVGRLSGEDS